MTDQSVNLVNCELWTLDCDLIIDVFVKVKTVFGNMIDDRKCECTICMDGMDAVGQSRIVHDMGTIGTPWLLSLRPSAI